MAFKSHLFSKAAGTARPAAAPQLNPFVPAYPVMPGQSGKPYRDAWDVERAVEGGVNRSVWVYRATQAIASNAAGLPMMMRQGNPDTGTPIADSSLDLFNFKSSPYEQAYLFRKRISLVLLLNQQGAMIEVVKDRFGNPVALYLLPPGYTWPIPDERTFVSAFRVQMPGRSWLDVPAENVLWVREPHPTDPYKGLTPLQAAGIDVEIDWYSRLYNRNFMLNDGRPGGILVLKSDMMQEDVEELRRRFYGNTGSGISGAGRTSVVRSDGGADFVDTAQSPRDAAYIEARTASKEAILSAFGVPESIAGDASGRSFNNASTEAKNFWRETMKNHLTLLSRCFDSLVPDPKKFYTFDLSMVRALQEDFEERSQFHLSEVSSGVITPDEYRAVTGRRPIGGPASTLRGPTATVSYATVGPSASYTGQEYAQDFAIDQAQLNLSAVEFKSLKSAAMIALAIPPEYFPALRSIGGDAQDYHLTLAIANNVRPSELAQIKMAAEQIAKKYGPVSAYVTGVGEFVHGEDGAPIVALVSGTVLHEMREELVRLLLAQNFQVMRRGQYVPHITLGYGEPGAIKNFALGKELVLTLPDYELAYQGEHEFGPLVGAKALARSGAPKPIHISSTATHGPTAGLSESDKIVMGDAWTKRLDHWEADYAKLLLSHFDAQKKAIIDELMKPTAKTREQKAQAGAGDNAAESSTSSEGQAADKAKADAEKLAVALFAGLSLWSLRTPAVVTMYKKIYRDFGVIAASKMGGKFTPSAPDWLGTLAKRENLIKGIDQTTFDTIKAVIGRAYIERQHHPNALAKILAKTFEQFSPARATLIARTEVAWTANHAGYFQAIASDRIVSKTWLAIEDRRTCSICEGLDGATVPLRSAFPMADQVPPAHPACRCTVAYNSSSYAFGTDSSGNF